MSDEIETQLEAVMRGACEAVKARNGGALPADDLMIYLAAEVVARDRTIAEAGQVMTDRIADKLNMDSRRREVALRAEVDTLTTDKIRLHDQLAKCAVHLCAEVARKTLNESAADGTQKLSRETAEVLDAHR